MSDTEYQAATGHTFTPYTNPTATPTFPPGTIQHQIQAEQENYKIQLRLFKE